MKTLVENKRAFISALIFSVVVGALYLALLFGLAHAADFTKAEVIDITLEQIENPNPQAMEAYTQLTGNPDEYLDRLYKSLERLQK